MSWGVNIYQFHIIKYGHFLYFLDILDSVLIILDIEGVKNKGIFFF